MELDYVRQRLGDLCADGQVSGAFIYGSAVYEPDCTPCGKEIDILVATPEVTVPLTDALCSVARTALTRSGIELDISCFTEKELVNARHNYYRKDLVHWFQEEAKNYPENIIGSSPVDIITPLAIDPLAAIASWFVQQRHMLRMTYVNGGYPNPEGLLQTVLDLPHKLGRASLWALQTAGHVSPNTLLDMRKESIADATRKVFGPADPRLIEIYDDLRREGDLYARLLNEARLGEVSEGEYEQLIAGTLAVNMPKSIEFVTQMLAAHLCSARSLSR